MSSISYQLVSMPSADAKLPPQAKTILSELENFGTEIADETTGLTRPKIVSRDDLVKSLIIDDEKNKLNARQPVERVIAFYQKRLSDEGYILIVKAAAPVKEKVEKTTKTKGKSKPPAGTAEEAAAANPENVANDLMA